MSMKTLNAVALGSAGAITSAGGMLVLGLLGNFGLYTGAVTMMGQWHASFSLSIGGIIGGMLEAAIISFIILYVFALVYNWLLTKSKN